MSEMDPVERVARALAYVDGADDWDLIGPVTRGIFERNARAAIAAMPAPIQMHDWPDEAYEAFAAKFNKPPTEALKDLMRQFRDNQKRAALPQGEPVAWRVRLKSSSGNWRLKNDEPSEHYGDAWDKEPLYAAPAMPVQDMLREAAQAVLDANADFRLNLPEDWEGDPLEDAIEELRIALGIDGAKKSAPAPCSSLPSGESDPAVTLDRAGADTPAQPVAEAGVREALVKVLTEFDEQQAKYVKAALSDEALSEPGRERCLLRLAALRDGATTVIERALRALSTSPSDGEG